MKKSDQANYYMREVFKSNRVVTSDTEDVGEVEIPLVDPLAPQVEISTARKVTINMGNFNSAGIEVGITVPCPLNEAQMEEAYSFAAAFCEKKLIEARRKVLGKE